MSQHGPPPSKLTLTTPGRSIGHLAGAPTNKSSGGAALCFPALATWPSDILCIVASFLDLTQVLKLKACGDTNFSRRIEQEPIIKDAKAEFGPWPQIIELFLSLRHLRTLTICPSDGNVQYGDGSWVLRLPPLIEELYFEFPSASKIWLCPATPGEIDWSLTNSHGHRPVFLCDLLPRLRHLKLAALPGFGNDDPHPNNWTNAMICLFIKKLPPSLQSLEVNMSHWTSDMFRMLPPNLERLSPPNFTSGPWITFPHDEATIFGDSTTQIVGIHSSVLPESLFTSLTHLHWCIEALGIPLPQDPSLDLISAGHLAVLPSSVLATDIRRFQNLQSLDLSQVNISADFLQHLPHNLTSFAFDCQSSSFMMEPGTCMPGKSRLDRPSFLSLPRTPIDPTHFVCLPDSLISLSILNCPALQMPDGQENQHEYGENGDDFYDEQDQDWDKEAADMPENMALDSNGVPEEPVEKKAEEPIPDFCSFLPPNLTSLSLWLLRGSWDASTAFGSMRNRLPRLEKLLIQGASSMTYESFSWVPITTLRDVTLSGDPINDAAFLSWPRYSSAPRIRLPFELPQDMPPLRLKLSGRAGSLLTNDVGGALPPNLTRLELEDVNTENFFGPVFLSKAPRTLISYSQHPSHSFGFGFGFGTTRKHYWEDVDILALDTPPHLQHLDIPMQLISFDTNSDMKKITKKSIESWRRERQDTRLLSSPTLDWILAENPSYPTSVTHINLPISVNPLSTIWNMSKLETMIVDRLDLSSKEPIMRMGRGANRSTKDPIILNFIPFTDPSPSSRPTIKTLRLIDGNAACQWFEWKPLRSLTDLKFGTSPSDDLSAVAFSLSKLTQLTRLDITHGAETSVLDALSLLDTLPPTLTWFESRIQNATPIPLRRGHVDSLRRFKFSHFSVSGILMDSATLESMYPHLISLGVNRFIFTAEKLASVLRLTPRDSKELTTLTLARTICPSIKTLVCPAENEFSEGELNDLAASYYIVLYEERLQQPVTREDARSLLTALPPSLEKWQCPPIRFESTFSSLLPSSLTYLDLMGVETMDISQKMSWAQPLRFLSFRGSPTKRFLKTLPSSLESLSISSALELDSDMAQNLPVGLKALRMCNANLTGVKEWKPKCLEHLQIHSLSPSAPASLPSTLTTLEIEIEPLTPLVLLLPTHLRRLANNPAKKDTFLAALDWPEEVLRLAFKIKVRDSLQRA